MTDHQPQRPMRKPPTPEQINRQQGFEPPKAKAEAAHAVVPTKPAAPVTPPSTVVAAASSTALTPFNREAFERNLVKWASGGLPPMTHNGLEGGFRTTGGEEADVSEKIFAAHLDETLREWIHFNGEGSPPTILSVGIYEYRELPARAELGETDEKLWEKDRFRGEPTDPWQEQFRAPIVSTDEGGEIYELTSRSPTSKNAFRALLNRYGRHPQRHKGMVPLIKLVDSTYFNKRLGTDKPKPDYKIVGWIAKDAPAAKPAKPELPFDDSIPF